MGTAHPWTYFSILSLLLLFLAISYSAKFDINQIIILTIIIILLFIMNKGIALLDSNMIDEIFGKSILTVFRSSDKSSLYLQFFVILGFVLAVEKISSDKKTILIISFLTVSLVSSYPMVLGGIKKFHDVNYSSSKQNYKVSSFSNIKKFPEDYLQMQKFFNNLNDDEKDRILILPYSVTASAGWTDIKTLKHRGSNPLLMLFKNSVIEANTYIFKSWVWGEYVQQGNYENWKFNIIKMLQVKYILLHKDVEHTRVLQGIRLMSELTEQKLFTKLKETKNLVLYEINRAELLDETIHLPKSMYKNVDRYLEFINILNDLNIEKKTDSLINFNEKKNNTLNFSSTIVSSVFALRENFYDIKEIKPTNINENFEIDYKKINNAKYILNISNLNTRDSKIKIVLNQSPSKFWVAKCLDCKKDYQFNNTFFNYYSNVFEADISSEDQKFQVEVYFFPEKYIRGILFLILIGLLFTFSYYLKITFYKSK